MRMMGEEIIFVAGIAPGAKDHARRIADLALNLQNHCTGLFTSLNNTMEFRIGIDTGGGHGLYGGPQTENL